MTKRLQTNLIQTPTTGSGGDAWEPLTEQVTDWQSATLEVSTEDRQVRNVVLSGLVSRNGYQYTADALQQAVDLYLQKPVFLDHAPNALRPFDRSTRDLVGTVTAARFEGGRVRGDIQVLNTEAGQTFLALIAGDPTAVGMSHVVLARRSSDGTTVDQIHDVISIDAVVFPATTRSLRESSSPSDVTQELLQEQLQAAQSELLHLRQQLQRQQTATETDQLLAASGLPDFACTAVFREQLRQAVDGQWRRQLIADRLQLLAARSQPSIQSRPRSPMDGESTTGAFVRAIRGGSSGVLCSH